MDKLNTKRSGGLLPTREAEKGSYALDTWNFQLLD